jgi:hypothetical protein
MLMVLPKPLLLSWELTLKSKQPEIAGQYEHE